MHLREARKLCRPDEILMPNEMDREKEFVALYLDVLKRMSGDVDHASQLEKVMARSVAADVWRYDRETSDGAVLLARVYNTTSYNESRRNAWKEADERTRLRSVFVDSAKQSLDILYSLDKAAKGLNQNRATVVRLKEVPRGKKANK